MCLLINCTHTHTQYLSVVKFKCGVVVVGVVVHPLIHHCQMAVDILSPFLKRPILSTLPATSLIGPAAQRHSSWNVISSQTRLAPRPQFKNGT